MKFLICTDLFFISCGKPAPRSSTFRMFAATEFVSLDPLPGAKQPS
jgi:hypothetical protein